MRYFNPIFLEFDLIVFPFQYVAYAEGLIRAYNIHTYAVHYTLQRKDDFLRIFFPIDMLYISLISSISSIICIYIIVFSIQLTIL